jgi:hypothetical protein
MQVVYRLASLNPDEENKTTPVDKGEESVEILDD